MTLTLKFEHPHLPEGQEIAVNFLGTAYNGSTLGLEEDAERMFLANRGMTVEDAFANDATVSVSGTSSLSRDETEQLIADANPAPVEDEAPAQENDTEVKDPNALILEGGGDGNG